METVNGLGLGYMQAHVWKPAFCFRKDLLCQFFQGMLLFYACVHKRMGLLGYVKNAEMGDFLPPIWSMVEGCIWEWNGIFSREEDKNSTLFNHVFLKG